MTFITKSLTQNNIQYLVTIGKGFFLAIKHSLNPTSYNPSFGLKFTYSTLKMYTPALITKIVSEYDKEISAITNRRQTAWHHEEEPHNHHETPGRQTKQSNQLSLPIKMIAILEWT